MTDTARRRGTAADAASSSGDPPLALVLDRLATHLADIRRLGVAYSGGIDSTLLVALTTRILGARHVVAVLGVSPSLAEDERAAAHEVATTLGVEVVEVVTHEQDREGYRHNGPERCYHCKDELFTRIDESLVRRLGLDAIAYGENADDALRPDRPGRTAAVEHRVLAPLADLGLTKADVRALARRLGLPNADKPAAPCLASRIPHFTEVDPAKLAQVETAERALHRLGFAKCRVRHHGDVARVELPTADLARAVADPVRSQLVTAVRAAGFAFVTVDLLGLQSGAFTLSVVARPRE